MRKIKNSSRDLISYFPTTINQKLIDGYRVKLFQKSKIVWIRKNNLYKKSK